MSDTITILRARRGKRLAKLIRADGTIEDYDAAARFDLFEMPVADLDAVHRFLLQLLHRPDCCIVRGVPIDPARTVNVRRLAHPDPETGDLATLRDASHCWVALDMDGVERPLGVPAADLRGCAAEAVQRLPVAFPGARCIVQASASHGIKPGRRLRLWYWLTRPTTGTELTRWLAGAPTDLSVFRPAQPIYTAAPVFTPGLQDHLPRRIAGLPGEPVVAVPPPEALQPPPPIAPRPFTMPAGGDRVRRYAIGALRRAVQRVASAPEGQRNDALNVETFSLARFIPDVLTAAEVANALAIGARHAGLTERETAATLVSALRAGIAA